MKNRIKTTAATLQLLAMRKRGWMSANRVPMAVFGLMALLFWGGGVEAARAQDWDFGDAPAVYPTRLANNGARHVIGPLFMGTFVDAEADGQPTPGADGDDRNPPQGVDDEDGVFFNAAFVPSVPGTLRVISSGPGLLQGWVDFNADGDWADAGEQIILDHPVVGGMNIVPYGTPVFRVSGTGVVTYARFRLATQAGLGYTGAASNGEVEDYTVKLSPLKWLQPPDLSVNGVDVDDEFELADDFLCTQTGPITDIHIWGSFRNDYEGIPQAVLTNLAFIVKFYADVPVGPNNALGYSHPGAVLWQMPFAPGQYQAGRCAQIQQPGEWWHTPPAFWQPGADMFCYQFDFFIDPKVAFRQSRSNIYWLSVQCVNQSGEYWFGWKSTDPTNHWNDDAVWLDYSTGAPTWRELRYGDGHPYANPLPGQSLDLSFAVSTEVEEEPATLDFGDAPDPSFPTLLASNGARHTILPNVFLGTSVDAELDGQPNPSATGDDIAGPVNDEDGVTFVGTLIPNQAYTINVTASVAGFLNAWVDFNADQSWAQPVDQIFNNQPLAAGLNVLTFLVPANAQWSTNVFARFRFTTATNNLGYLGLAPDGEVEDYRMTMEPFPQHDLGDAPSSLNNFSLPMTAYPLGGPAGVIANFPTAIVFPGPLRPVGPIHMMPTNVAYLGANVTFESNADIGPDQDLINNIAPALDKPDLDAADDGVMLPLTLPHCRNTVLNYFVTITSLPPPGANLFVNVWFDWNRDGDWNDSLVCPDGVNVPEWAVANQPVPVPPGPYPMTIPMTSPPFRASHPAMTNQPIWMRIILAEQPWPPAGGAAPAGGEGPINGYLYGETEDYYVTHYNVSSELDFGDTPAPYPTLAAANGARHWVIPGFSLGPQLDAEPDGLPDPLALGDDNNNVSDEDGVVFATPLLVNTQACVDVFLAGPLGGFLDAWVDFNGNGAWEMAEQVFNAQGLSAGKNAGLCFNVPVNVKLGTNFARFRLSSAGGLRPVGAAQDGEVEDYLVLIKQRAPSTNIVITSVNVTNTTPSNQVVTLQWNAETNVHYEVLGTTNLGTNNGADIVWQMVGSKIIGPTNQIADTNVWTNQRYYRVRAPWTYP